MESSNSNKQYRCFVIKCWKALYRVSLSVVARKKNDTLKQIESTKHCRYVNCNALLNDLTLSKQKAKVYNAFQLLTTDFKQILFIFRKKAPLLDILKELHV